MSNALIQSKGNDGKPRDIAAVPTSDGGFAVGVAVQDGAILAAIWTGPALTGAPDPELYGEGQIGATGAGVAASATYHVIGAIGSKAWVATGATVANLYGA